MLRTREMIPPLAARTHDGRTVHARDYKHKKNLVIAFLHSGCRRCEHFLERLAEHAVSLYESEALVLAIFSEVPPTALAEPLPREVVVAADPTGSSQRAYLGKDAFGPGGQRSVGVFVADRSGEIHAHWVVRTEEDLPSAAEVLGWLGQIEAACMEWGGSQHSG